MIQPFDENKLFDVFLVKIEPYEHKNKLKIRFSLLIVKEKNNDNRYNCFNILADFVLNDFLENNVRNVSEKDIEKISISKISFSFDFFNDFWINSNASIKEIKILNDKEMIGFKIIDSVRTNIYKSKIKRKNKEELMLLSVNAIEIIAKKINDNFFKLFNNIGENSFVENLILKINLDNEIKDKTYKNCKI